jgi:bacteriorhodopsin
MKEAERKILLRFLLAGFLIPCSLFAVILIGDVKMGRGLTWMFLIPWPILPLMMSAEPGGGSSGEILAFLISAIANVIVYGAVGRVVAVVYRRFFLREQ